MVTIIPEILFTPFGYARVCSMTGYCLVGNHLRIDVLSCGNESVGANGHVYPIQICLEGGKNIAPALGSLVSNGQFPKYSCLGYLCEFLVCAEALINPGRRRHEY